MIAYLLLLFYCGQTAPWIKMPLGTEVDLGPSHTVLYGVIAAKKFYAFKRLVIIKNSSSMSKESTQGCNWYVCV